MTCAEFRSILEDGMALESTFAKRESLKKHLEECPQCDEYINRFEPVRLDQATEAAATRVREADEKITKYPMTPKQKKNYGMED